MTAVLAERIGRAGRPQCRIHRDAELAAWHTLLASIDGDEWQRRTVCAEWDVADIAGHLIGQAEDVNRLTSFPRRYRKAKRVYPDVLRIDAHMMVQADEHRGTAPARLRAEFDDAWGRATRRISTEPGLLRRMSMTFNGFRMNLGYIHDILLARDLWMHRDDVCQALGRPFDVGPYGAELVAQVMYDVIDGPWWGDRPAVELDLTGPAGGTYQLGRGEPVGRGAVDAVGYMRTLSGRDNAPAVTGDPAATEAIATCRMPF
ncbi:maleylpyruvate isomerase family mycothiol-dependent enzyme [Kribbella sp.]|uniref:maleylpyruvate isomerase family mycothiol-dependent enzyme n=1 Tax=Kribbella sp. TaxID=1871183 RepID=UPI002D65D048|nr:maleylpyruvate isomerase family mycothiol-dependent enzyme [Kribbella sp.]HZX06135.1 maleylpyruvate isomerase family mycothiol-dependent enzyme [Kribbella sp.]